MYPVTFPDGNTVNLTAQGFASYEVAAMKAGVGTKSADQTMYPHFEEQYVTLQGKANGAQQAYQDALARQKADLQMVLQDPRISRLPQVQAMMKADPTGMSLLNNVVVKALFPAVAADLANVEKTGQALGQAQGELAPVAEWLQEHPQGGGGGTEAAPTAAPVSGPGAATPPPTGPEPPTPPYLNGKPATVEQFAAWAKAKGVTEQSLKAAGKWDQLPFEYQDAISGTKPAPASPASTANPPKPAPVPARPPKPATPQARPTARDSRPPVTPAGNSDANVDRELAAATSVIANPGAVGSAYARAGQGQAPPMAQVRSAGPGKPAPLTDQQIAILRREWGKISPEKRRQLIGRYAIPRTVKLALDAQAGVSTP